MWQYQDELGRAVNFCNWSFMQLFDHLHIQHMEEVQCPYVRTWEERISARRNGAGGSGRGDVDEDDEEENED